MERTPPATIPYDHVRAYYDARLRAPAVVFRAAVAETLTDWRLGRANQPVDFSGAEEIFRAGVAELLEIRLRLACLPLFNGLRRLERRFAVLADLRDDPYAPDPGRRDLIETEVRPPGERSC